jgi:hypothetical protein
VEEANMWLLAIEIIMAIVAAARGWGAIPFALIGGSLIFGLLLGFSGSYDTITFATIVDWIITAIVTGMAIVGRNRSENTLEQNSGNQGTSHPVVSRIKCPYCAEMIQVDAKICRFCNRDLTKKREIPQISTHPDSIDTEFSDIPLCSQCGLPMKVKKATSGPREGDRFYVCPNYKTCGQIFPVEK